MSDEILTPVETPVDTPAPVSCETEPMPEDLPAVIDPIPSATKRVKTKKNLPLVVRLLLKFLTFLLCILLTISLSLTLVIMDLQALVSHDTLIQAADQLLYTPISQPRLSENPGEDFAWIEDVIYDAVKDKEGQEDITKGEISDFVDNGSITKFLKEKTVGYLECFLKGDQGAVITIEDIEQLLDDNEALIEDVFGVTLDHELRQGILDYLYENKVDDMVHEKIFETIESIPLGDQAFTVGDLMQYIRPIFSSATLMALIIFDLMLCVAIFFTKRMRLGGTLLTVGCHVFSVGTVGIIPLVLLQDLLTEDSVATRFAQVFLNTVTDVHCGFLFVGVVLAIAGIVFKIVLRPKKVTA